MVNFFNFTSTKKRIWLSFSGWDDEESYKLGPYRLSVGINRKCKFRKTQPVGINGKGKFGKRCRSG